MTGEQLGQLKNWLRDYADGFIARADNPEAHILKKAHTIRVCREIVDLGQALGLGRAELLLAEAAACLHDAGRFRQMAQYGTFVDDLSEDHAQMGLRVMEEEGLLVGLSDREAGILRTAVACHNVAVVPKLADETALLFVRLLRDADKLDIWRVVTSDYRLGDKATPDFVRLGLADNGGYSAEALQAVMAQRLVNKAEITCLNDFKLMQISWVFDLNFAPSVRAVAARGYIPAILATLPEAEELRAIRDRVEAYMAAFSPDIS